MKGLNNGSRPQNGLPVVEHGGLTRRHRPLRQVKGQLGPAVPEGNRAGRGFGGIPQLDFCPQGTTKL